MIHHKGKEKAGENNDHNPLHLSVPELLIQVTLTVQGQAGHSGSHHCTGCTSTGQYDSWT